MGSHVSPSYVNGYMGLVEDQYVYEHSLFKFHAVVWYRFIDNIFVVSGRDMQSLMELGKFLSEMIAGLHFKTNHDMHSILFLDVKVLLETDLYIKPTDSNQLLLHWHPLVVF